MVLVASSMPTSASFISSLTFPDTLKPMNGTCSMCVSGMFPAGWEFPSQCFIYLRRRRLSYRDKKACFRTYWGSWAQINAIPVPVHIAIARALVRAHGASMGLLDHAHATCIPRLANHGTPVRSFMSSKLIFAVITTS